jgi:hypothetical protein
MSGGSWDYVGDKVHDPADRLLKESCPYRRALGRRLKLIAVALHEIEWVDSGDTSPGDEMSAVRAALGGGRAAVAAALVESVASAKDAQAELAMLLSEAEAMGG